MNDLKMENVTKPVNSLSFMYYFTIIIGSIKY